MNCYSRLFSTIVFSAVLAGCATTSTTGGPDRAENCANPLPDYTVSQPGAGVSDYQASYSGVWVGRWDGKLCHTLVVENISVENVSVIYSYGVSVEWNIRRGNYRRHNAEFEGEKLVLERFRSGAVASYRLVDDQLKGEYVNSDGEVTPVTLRRAEAG